MTERAMSRPPAKNISRCRFINWTIRCSGYLYSEGTAEGSGSTVAFNTRSARTSRMTHLSKNQAAKPLGLLSFQHSRFRSGT